MASPANGFRVGQQVAVGDLPWGVCLREPSAGLPRYVVVSADADAVVLASDPPGTTLRIPAYLIKSEGAVPRDDTQAA